MNPHTRTYSHVQHGALIIIPCGERMYGRAYGWERQSWKDDPRQFGAQNRPTDYQPSNFFKRQQHPLTATGNSTEADHEEAVCLVDQAARHQESGDLDLDGLQLVDMDGNPIDGQSCDIIYDYNDPESRTRIVVDEDGVVVDMYVEDADADMWGAGGCSDGGVHESPVTSTTFVTTIQASAEPCSGEASLAIPASTSLTRTRVNTVVTVAPAV